MTVNPQMSISEVLNMDRKTANIFLAFGMHCLGCPHASAESIQDACAAHGQNPEELVKKLNDYFAQQA